MEKRNTLLLTVIAVATLLVSVVGATFAYFVSVTSGEGVSTTLDVEAQASTAQFLATGADIQFTVTGANMLKGDAGDTTVAGTDTDTLKVDLTSSTAGKCTYDIKFAWDSGSSYVPSTGLGTDQKEFTVKATLTTNTNATTGENKIEEETNFDKVVALDQGIVVKGATLTVDGSNEAHAVWTFVATMYNLNLDQSALANGADGKKSYNGAFTVANVVC